jgi:integrase
MTVAIYRTATGWGCRIRCGGDIRPRVNIPDMPEAEAQSRADRMAAMAQALSAAGKGPECKVILGRAASAKTEAMFREAEQEAREIVAAAGVIAKPREPKTFRDVANLWTSGELHRRFPKRMKEKGESSMAASRGKLEKLCAVVGSVPIAKFSVVDAERALAALPASLEPITYRQYALTIGRVLKLAAFPLQLIERSPLPEGWLPAGAPSRAFQLIYPDEDAQLVSCRMVSLVHRLLWGFLCREGMRPEEAMRLVWDDLDLERGTVRLDKNKTRRPRSWRLGDDVVQALTLFRLTHTGDRLFAAAGSLDRLAAHLRADLLTAGVVRRELHETTKERRRLRAHDLRGAFATVAMASGHAPNEAWVMRRTGHTTSSMLATYSREIAHGREIGLSWFGPLDVLAYPDQTRAKTRKLPANAAGPQSPPWTSNRNEPARSEAFSAVAESPTAPKRGAGPAGLSTPGQEVELTLARAVEMAIKAEQWDLAMHLTRELGERRRARESQPGVASLDAARRRKSGDEK